MSPKKKTTADNQIRRANTTIRKRIMLLAGVFGVATFLILFGKLWMIQIVNHNKFEELAIAGQTRDLTVSANRGKITDSKGTTLAISATVHNVVLSPKDIIKEKYDKNLIATGLAEILDLDSDKLLKRMEKAISQYEVIATKVEDEKADEVRQFILQNKLSRGIHLEADTKRYYPKSSMAAQVLGFVNSENRGSYGLENIYDSDLAGQKGRIVTSRAASGVEMISGYEAYVDAENGRNLALTIDANIQAKAQHTLEVGIEKFEVLEGGFCIVMNPKTGAIYAMVSAPDYDLNNPSSIKDTRKTAELAAMKAKAEVLLAEEAASKASAEPAVTTEKTEDQKAAEGQEPTQQQEEKQKTPGELLMEEYRKALGEAQHLQWRSKAMNDSYEPGSTFKPIVMAMGLEQGLITESSTFYCSGQMKVPGWDKPIKCHNHNGHGTQDTRHALMNSCNPAMIQIGQKIGNNIFYDYMKDFGLLEKTGVDMQGEGIGYFWPQDQFKNNIVSLATASFGQRFQITPIELITALSSVINGGHLMEPYVVQSVTDSNGNVVQYHEPTEVRQVISQQTSDLVRSMMESVVGDGGTGKNAFVNGYRIGGKTGTSQTRQEGHLITSFVGFAPADDPEIIVLLAFDHPKPSAPGSNLTSGGHYISGGNMAAPMAGQLIADILDYMGVQKEGGPATGDVMVPNVNGKTLDAAQAALKSAGLSWKIVGKGGTVTDQTPKGGTAIPSGSTVVLYLGEEKSEAKVTVPDVMGRTYSAAKSALEDRGLYMKAPSHQNASKMVAFSQSIEAGTEVDPGTVVEVRFLDNTVQDYAND